MATLIAALPMLGLSLTALAIFAAAPDRFARLLARLTQEAFIRLGLVFTPAALLSLVLLALLVLFFSAMGRGLDRSSAQPGRGPAQAVASDAGRVGAYGRPGFQCHHRFGFGSRSDLSRGSLAGRNQLVQPTVAVNQIDVAASVDAKAADGG